MDGDSISVVSMMDFWTGGSGPKDIWSMCSCLTTYKPNSQLLIETPECLNSIILKAMYKVKQHSNICCESRSPGPQYGWKEHHSDLLSNKTLMVTWLYYKMVAWPRNSVKHDLLNNKTLSEMWPYHKRKFDNNITWLLHKLLTGSFYRRKWPCWRLLHL